MATRLPIFLLLIGLYACGHETATPKKHIVDPRAKKLVDSAEILIVEQQQYEKALPLLNQALQIDSSYVRPYSHKLSCQWQLKQWDSCLKTAYSLLRIQPNNADRYGEIGLLYYYKGDSILSKKFYMEALSRYGKILDTMSLKIISTNSYYLIRQFFLFFLTGKKKQTKYFKMPLRNSQTNI